MFLHIYQNQCPGDCVGTHGLIYYSFFFMGIPTWVLRIYT